MTDAPLATYRYSLNWQDALAYERLPKDLPGLQKITLYIWLALAGIFLIALPPDIAGEPNTPRFWFTGAGLVVLQYLIFFTLRAITRLNRARYRYPATVDAELSQWPERLEYREHDELKKIPFEEIGALLPTARHLFIAAGPDLVIVPVSAFGDAGRMAKLVDAIDGYMRKVREAQAAPGSGAADNGHNTTLGN
ncbi:MAG TPA: hypothetical protein VL418_00225 [Devosiaceae bacterium]|nr:hypothetical protein [Devosiaceae bacterium]